MVNGVGLSTRRGLLNTDAYASNKNQRSCADLPFTPITSTKKYAYLIEHTTINHLPFTIYYLPFTFSLLLAPARAVRIHKLPK